MFALIYFASTGTAVQDSLEVVSYDTKKLDKAGMLMFTREMYEYKCIYYCYS